MLNTVFAVSVSNTVFGHSFCNTVLGHSCAKSWFRTWLLLSSLVQSLGKESLRYMSKKALSKQHLERLGKEKLAELVIELGASLRAC